MVGSDRPFHLTVVVGSDQPFPLTLVVGSDQPFHLTLVVGSDRPFPLTLVVGSDRPFPLTLVMGSDRPFHLTLVVGSDRPFPLTLVVGNDRPPFPLDLGGGQRLGQGTTEDRHWGALVTLLVVVHVEEGAAGGEGVQGSEGFGSRSGPMSGLMGQGRGQGVRVKESGSRG